jgi:hypothetical protein
MTILRCASVSLNLVNVNILVVPVFACTAERELVTYLSPRYETPGPPALLLVNVDRILKASKQ